MSRLMFLGLLAAMASCVLPAEPIKPDPKGYVMYCPCMGRFGNQADQFLGALSFARGLDRTLVLPPWVEYHPHKRNSVQVPFDTYFKVEAVAEYHRVITMERFMKELAPTVWPEGKRIVFCYTFRNGGKENDCNAKDGNPFGPFWNTFNINFDNSLTYKPLYYNTNDSPRIAKAWNEKFPPSEFPVLAFTGAPAAFPVAESDVPLQAHLQWSQTIDDEATKFIVKNFKGSFLGIHMRNGIDWKSACEHTGRGQHLFGTPTCLGYMFEHGDEVTKDMCLPSDSLVLKQVKKMVKETKVTGLFVATDDRDLIDKFKKELKITVVKYEPSDPHVDLAILEKADYHIGNCVSTFSSFAVRARRVRGRPVSFWGFQEKTKKDEL